ncbi:hypothetical protein GBA65_08735 [Rubrobacter marinus]|uniref:Uncharacterized protein n=1 Tax=Rubrobacter marinus TaxID=2653852 RepID=A0A6G8PWK9_9ACTN|nr:hypothetical protein [Rubrobacter marinus]QIN78592.1 hypothetical protein GBA65_08735 [Rubrobacter marinus]
MLWIVAGASLFVVAFDALGSLAARRLGFPYAVLTVVSLLVYGTTGALAADQSGVTMGTLAAGIVGLVDSTLGWAVSRKLGAGRLPNEAPRPGVSAGTVLLVSLLAAAIGLVGGSVVTAG